MAEPNNKRSSLNVQMKGGRKQAGRSTDSTPPGMGSGSSSTSRVPCGACKFLRRRCVDGCIFAPHFGPDQGTAQFAAVHKIFGASNMSKILVQVPPHLRYYAVQTMAYEAQARLANPAGGCVSVINDLYQQVASLQVELEMEKNKNLIAERLIAEYTPQGPLQQPEQLNNPELPPSHHLNLQPMYSNGSTATNMVSMNMFDPNPHNLAKEHQHAAYSQPIFDPVLFTEPGFKNEVDDVEKSRYPFVFDDQTY